MASSSSVVFWPTLSMVLLVMIFSSWCVVPIAAETYELTIDITGEDYDHVTNLTSDNFESSVSDGRTWFVEFFAPWCGHCQRLAPIWKDLAKDLLNESHIRVARVDATEETSLADQFDVSSYPSLKLLRNKGELVFEYSGRRSLQALAKWTRKMARPPIVELKDSSALSEFLTKEGWPAGFVFFGDSKSTEYDIIKREAEKRLSEVAFSSLNNEEVSKKYDIASPTLVAFHKGNKFDSLSEITEESVRDFVYRHKLPYFDQIQTNNSDFYIGEAAYRRTVLAIVYPNEDSNYQTFLTHMESIAKTHTKLFSFSWLNGGEWTRWLKEVLPEGKEKNTEKRRLVVFDGYRSVFYESSKTDLKNSQSIIDFITAVHDNDLERVGAVVKGEGTTLWHKSKLIFSAMMAEFRKDRKTRKIALLMTFTGSALCVSGLVLWIFGPPTNKRKTN
eukprot:TRINITY_DN7408_c0_g1_i1.p1 TRINITY_DN7408_c0_g1~~TRINITY_DN7408_c0_g1_i1.p1  ORF type:complete len:446 (-),score=102.49 TRINITY_DN7408_c0_g1_i1:27-1364(-)